MASPSQSPKLKKRKSPPGSPVPIVEPTPVKPERSSSESSIETATSIRGKQYLQDLAHGDIDAIIDNVTVRSVDDFIVDEFPGVKTGPTVADDLFHEVPYNQGRDHVRESSMYPPLITAFNMIATKSNLPQSGKSLKCISTSIVMNAFKIEQAIDAQFAPDLFLTAYSDEVNGLFEKVKSKSKNKKDEDLWKETLFRYPGVLIEVKRAPSANFPWQHDDKDSLSAALNKDARELLDQLHRYVAYAQYTTLPYRHIYCITVTAQWMRFWKWTASGVRVSDAFKYQEKVKVVARFVQALQLGDDEGLGLNVGENMLFRRFPRPIGWNESDESERVEVLSELYVDYMQPVWDKWPEAANNAGVYLLPSKKIDGSTTPLKEYVVLQYPIYSTIGIFGRGTRCYLAIERTTFEDEDFVTMGDDNLLPLLRTFKTSWQFMSRSREDTFYTAAGKVEHLASLIGGGGRRTIPTVRWFSGLGGKTPREESHFYIRELRWVMLSEVGRRITTLGSSGGLIRVLCNCLRAYEGLEKRGILHRDISANNILVVNPELGGLVVDLDMAKYIGIGSTISASEQSLFVAEQQRKDARPAITGTMVFTAIALAKSPHPASWHDYESFFWLLVWCTIRHCVEARLVFPGGHLPLYSHDDRKKGLDQVFPYETARVDEAREHGALAKLEFLQNCSIVTPKNPALQVLINSLRYIFKEHYVLLRSLQATQDTITRLLKLADKPSPFISTPYSASTPEQVKEHEKEILKQAAVAQSLVSQDPISADELKFAVIRLKESTAYIDKSAPFPTFDVIVKYFEQALPALQKPPADMETFEPMRERKPKAFKT
ncbi:hypothetical protein FRB91_007958 [Serendipita sp. 411]|nr:hypothetical protein FRB91_007958 [Serendipita sp. 411]